MDQINAIINCDVSHLGREPERISVRVGHSARIGIKGVPDDVTGVTIRVFRPDGAYYDIPANCRPNGTYLAYVIGTAFPEQGDAMYEVRATDARGNPTAIARGRIDILPFSVSTDPIEPGTAITVAQIPTEDGAMVQVRMVMDETGNWVYKAIVL